MPCAQPVCRGAHVVNASPRVPAVVPTAEPLPAVGCCRCAAAALAAAAARAAVVDPLAHPPVALAARVVDVDAPAWRALLKGGRIPLSDLPAEMMEMSPGTAVARHGGSSITLWRGAADAVTVMVRGDDLERLRRGLPADRPYLRYAVAVAAVAAIAVMRRR